VAIVAVREGVGGFLQGNLGRRQILANRLRVIESGRRSCEPSRAVVGTRGDNLKRALGQILPSYGYFVRIEVTSRDGMEISARSRLDFYHVPQDAARHPGAEPSHPDLKRVSLFVFFGT